MKTTDRFVLFWNDETMSDIFYIKLFFFTFIESF